MSEKRESREVDAQNQQQEERKKEIWLTVIVMVVSFCVGASILLFFLWVLFTKILPVGFLS